MCVCVKETERDAFDDRKKPSWDSSLLVIETRRTIFHTSAKKTSTRLLSTQFSRYFKVFTMHLYKVDSELGKYHYSVPFKIPRYRKHATFLHVMRKTGPVAASQYQIENSTKQGDYRQRYPRREVTLLFLVKICEPRQFLCLICLKALFVSSDCLGRYYSRIAIAKLQVEEDYVSYYRLSRTET
jgi:hypothetical protein